MNSKNKVQYTLLIVLLISISSILIGCASSEESSLSLVGTVWELDSYLNDAGEMVKALPDTAASIEFNEDQASGKASCNNYNAGYTQNGEKISFGMAISTLMMCSEPEGIMDQEQTYLANLAAVASYQIAGEQLTLFNSDGKAILIYAAQTQ